jgi:hypothetical protein
MKNGEEEEDNLIFTQGFADFFTGEGYYARGTYGWRMEYFRQANYLGSLILEQDP